METRYNAVVGQSGGPTCAINATLAGVIAGCVEAKANGKIDKIYGMKNGMEGFLNKSFIELEDRFSDKEQLDALCMTPASALGSCRLKLTKDEQFEATFKILEEYNIKYFFYIGGNDSMDAVAKLEKYKKEHPQSNPCDTCFIGVPKTIDNDLCCTDHTPGFGSAAKYIATSLAEITRDCEVYLQKAVTIVEIMGRDAGWLTASAALTKKICGYGADLIYLPEVAFDTEEFLNNIRRLMEKPGKNSIVVAVSEGIRDINGDYVGKAAMSGVTDSFGHAYLAGTGKYLENVVREKIGCKCRSVELNVLQRCASHLASKTDIDESFRIGKAGVSSALDGKSGRMMVFERKGEGENYFCSVNDADIAGAANNVKKVPAEFISESKTGVTDECIEYLLPLITGEYEVKFKNGLPVHFVF